MLASPRISFAEVMSFNVAVLTTRSPAFADVPTSISLPAVAGLMTTVPTAVLPSPTDLANDMVSACKVKMLPEIESARVLEPEVMPVVVSEVMKVMFVGPVARVRAEPGRVIEPVSAKLPNTKLVAVISTGVTIERAPATRVPNDIGVLVVTGRTFTVPFVPVAFTSDVVALLNVRVSP